MSGDTLFYYDADSTGIFFGNVVIRWDSGVVKADTGIFYLTESGLDSMILKGNCRLIREDKDSDIYLNALLFRVYFVNDSLRELIAEKSNGVLRGKNNE